MSDIQKTFSTPQAVAQYVDGPPRFVPGLFDLHRMTAILIAEQTGPDAQVLALGAGGGMELKSLAQDQPGWTFCGIDPAPEMLKLATQTLGPLAARADLHEGYIDDAPQGPFDAAVCLLTLHFLEREERERTLAEIRRRLKPGAPFVVAHTSFPQGTQERARWLSRYTAFAIASGAEPEQTKKARAAVEANLTILSPEDDEATLRAAGFVDITPFYTAFTWRGWVAYA